MGLDEKPGRVAEVATRQHGVVSRAQLREIGWSRSQIQRRIESGYLRRLHHGIYAVGHASLSMRSKWMAAVLFAGPTAVLSHRSAAALWGLSSISDGSVEVSRSTGGHFSDPVLTIHRAGTLPARDRTRRDRIPITTPARTLVDLASSLSDRELDDHLSAARRLGRFDPKKIKRVIADRPNRPGGRRIAERIGLFERSQGITRSELETRFLRLCSDAGLPLPRADVAIGSEFVDFHWHEHRLIVEVDSRAFHVHQFDEDRSRDLAHLVNGYRTVRVTHAIMEQAPGRLVESLRRLLSNERVPR
jgi:hypothetical protein